MAEPRLKQKVMSELKKKGLNYKIRNLNADVETESITFIDAYKGSQIHGKIIRSFTEGEVNRWPALKHENLAPLIDVLRIRDDLYVYLTIDHRVTLKKIVHDEAFVYDPGCFDRKRTFARGIFSGLAYLHAQSLCLMNLCDNNIVISESRDRAVITNFSHLICSNEDSRPKLVVPEMYKAPESEKGEFDAIAAEIWASGILMLDMFLAHMVPWDVVDYEPKRVVELVNDLSLDLLQAANAGSNVSPLELTKFKIFLKCFFKQNPLDRLAAKYASIASFLQQKLKPSLYVFSEDAFLGTNIPPQKIKMENATSKSPNFGNINYQKLNHCNLEQPREDLTMSAKQTSDTESSSYSSAVSIPRTRSGSKNSNLDIVSIASAMGRRQVSTSHSESSININKFDRGAPSIPSERSTSKNSSSDIISNASEMDRHQVSTSHAGISMNINKLGKRDGILHISSPIFYNNKDSYTFPKTTIEFPNNVKSYQPIRQAGDVNAESNFNSYQSKSLPFIQCNLNDSKNIVPFQYYSNRTSPPSIRPSSLKQSNEDDSEITGLCLDRLLEDGDSVEVECTNSVRGTNSSQSLHACEVIDKMQSTTNRSTFKLFDCPWQTLEKSGIDIERFSRTYTLFLLNKSDIIEIKDKIAFLKRCHSSVQWHQRRFISNAFEQKRRKLLVEYQDLLHKENLRLHGTLKRRYGFKMEDVSQVLNLVNFNENHYKNHVKSSTNQCQCKCNSRFLHARNTNDVKADFGNGKHSLDKSEDTTVHGKLRKSRFVEARKTNKNENADFVSTMYCQDKLKDTTALKSCRMYSVYSAPDSSTSDLRNAKAKEEFNANVFPFGSKSHKKSLEQSAKAGHPASIWTFGKNFPGNLENTKKEQNKTENYVNVKYQKNEMNNNNFPNDKNKREEEESKKRAKQRRGKKDKKKKKQKTKVKKEKSAKNEKAPHCAKHEQSKWNCLCLSILCPFGKPVPSVDHLCEACRLNLGAMS